MPNLNKIIISIQAWAEAFLLDICSDAKLCGLIYLDVSTSSVSTFYQSLTILFSLRRGSDAIEAPGPGFAKCISPLGTLPARCDQSNVIYKTGVATNTVPGLKQI